MGNKLKAYIKDLQILLEEESEIENTPSCNDIVCTAYDVGIRADTVLSYYRSASAFAGNAFTACSVHKTLLYP